MGTLGSSYQLRLEQCRCGWAVVPAAELIRVAMGKTDCSPKASDISAFWVLVFDLWSRRKSQV